VTSDQEPCPNPDCGSRRSFEGFCSDCGRSLSNGVQSTLPSTADRPLQRSVPEPTAPSKSQRGPRRERWAASPEFKDQLLKDAARIILDGRDGAPTDAMWRALGVAWAIIMVPQESGGPEPSEKLGAAMGSMLKMMGLTVGDSPGSNPIFLRSLEEVKVLLYEVGRP
jgi:hypothetical protein